MQMFEAEAHMPWGAVKLQPMDGGSNRACRGVTQGQTGLRPQHHSAGMGVTSHENP